jgi:hypothetical protein
MLGSGVGARDADSGERLDQPIALPPESGAMLAIELEGAGEIGASAQRVTQQPPDHWFIG